MACESSAAAWATKRSGGMPHTLSSSTVAPLVSKVSVSTWVLDLSRCEFETLSANLGAQRPGFLRAPTAAVGACRMALVLLGLRAEGSFLCPLCKRV